MKYTLLFKAVSLRYKVLGSGPVLVLLHGFGEDSSIWEQFAATLSRSYRLIIPDIPGSGASEMLPEENVGIDDYAEALQAILHSQAIEECTMIGHSMGGYIALAFAEKYPQILRAIGLFHSSAYADDEAKKETRKKAIEFIKANSAIAFLKTSMPGLFMDAGLSKADIDDLLQKGQRFRSEVLVQYYNAMLARPDRTAVLKTFAGPVLFILGRHDKAVPLVHGLQQSHLSARTHIHILRESAHMGMLEEPEKSLLNVTDFLNQIYV